MDAKAVEPYGLALLDFFGGDASAKVIVHRDDGEKGDLPVSIFFREPSGFSAIEQRALDLCRGRVLDAGAGAGCHSLDLQERGVSVCAIDISPQAVEIMRKRGVREVECADLLEYRGGPFCTILMMLRSIGMVEDLCGLDRFLAHVHDLLPPDGQIVFDSLDVRCTSNPRRLAYQEAIRQAGRHVGEGRIRFEYKGLIGPFAGWLRVDPQTLSEHAGERGWACRVILQEEVGCCTKRGATSFCRVRRKTMH